MHLPLRYLSRASLASSYISGYGTDAACEFCIKLLTSYVAEPSLVFYLSDSQALFAPISRCSYANCETLVVISFGFQKAPRRLFVAHGLVLFFTS